MKFLWMGVAREVGKKEGKRSTVKKGGGIWD